MARFGYGAAFSLLMVLGMNSSLIYAEEAAKRIAVVDVGRVFETYAKVADVKARVSKEYAPKQIEIKTADRTLQERELKLRNDPRAKQKDAAFFKEYQAFEAQKFDFDMRLEALQKEIAAREAAEMRAVLEDIKGAIALVAKSEHYDLVLRCPDDDTPPASGDKPHFETMQEMVARFRRNPILTFNPNLDITAKIITTLNDEYKKAIKN